jgi:opacity protein-like surface antigen
MKARVLLFKSGIPCPWAVSAVQAFLLLALASIAAVAAAQSPDANPFFARKNTFSFFGAYSNDSSHMLLGYAANRKLLDFGAGYSRRLFVNHIVDWQYNGEILPVALDSEPVQITTNTSTVTFTNGLPTITFTESLEQPTLGACLPSTSTTIYPLPTGTQTTVSVNTCGRTWVIGEAISPVGFQWNFLPRRKLQPFIIGHGGYMYSTQPIPIIYAGSFNFTFDIGAGIELYRSKTQSIRAEYRFHHISNHGTAQFNPGIDNGLFQVTYSFGR